MATSTTNTKNVNAFAFWILMIVMILSCYQIYLFRIFDSYLPVVSIFSLLSLLSVRSFPRGDVLTSLWIIYALWNAIALAWSPSLGLWQYQMIFGNVFFLSYFVARQVNSTSLVIKLLKAFLFSGALNAILVMIFRVNTDLEASFIGNFLQYFKNPDRLTAEAMFNVSSPQKSGGVFDNGNTAATFHLVSFGIATLISKSFSRPMYILLLLLNFIAIVASGSKSALALFFIVGALSLLSSTRYIQERNVALQLLIPLFFIVVPIFSWFIFYGNFADSFFFQDTIVTSNSRARLLRMAIYLFSDHPFLGLGFGGWAIEAQNLSKAFDINPSWPPHNVFVEAWANCGIPNVILMGWLTLVLLSRTIKKSMVEDRYFALGGLQFATFGVIAMTLGDPQPFLGTPQVAAALGVAHALIAGNLRKTKRTRNISV